MGIAVWKICNKFDLHNTTLECFISVFCQGIISTEAYKLIQAGHINRQTWHMHACTHTHIYIHTERDHNEFGSCMVWKKSFIKEGKIIKNLSSLIVSVKSSHIIISYIFMRFRTGIACWEHLSAEQYSCSFTTIH